MRKHLSFDHEKALVIRSGGRFAQGSISRHRGWVKKSRPRKVAQVVPSPAARSRASHSRCSKRVDAPISLRQPHWPQRKTPEWCGSYKRLSTRVGRRSQTSVRPSVRYEVNWKKFGLGDRYCAVDAKIDPIKNLVVTRITDHLLSAKHKFQVHYLPNVYAVFCAVMKPSEDRIFVYRKRCMHALEQLLS